MAELKPNGNVVIRCPGCKGALSTYEYQSSEGKYGAIRHTYRTGSGIHWEEASNQFRLFKCAGCGRGGLGYIRCSSVSYPSPRMELLWFVPESAPCLDLPKDTPNGIQKEFREAESCLHNGCFRAAAGLFRSVLEKTLRANGYTSGTERNLQKRIDAAAKDGVITEQRRKRAHEELRVLGNDVLHEDWMELKSEDVILAHQYMQRIIEDFYDDRPTVETMLIQAQRLPKQQQLH